MSYKTAAFDAAEYFFAALNKEIVRPTPVYSESPSLIGLQPYQQINKYFACINLADDKKDAIACTKSDKPPPTPENFRLRGKSDDLYIDRSLPLFKSTTPASLNWTGSDKNNYTAKLNATAMSLGEG